MDKQTTGQRIREKRDAMGLTQESLARIAGVTTGTVARAERDEHEPTAVTLDRLAHALRCPVAELRG